ncbi:hypothetical protein KHQ06_25735 [Nocardia tengchongensis]|uniref:Uncharacterized protein n=1 Tax=Nocardia tengchongensis TaxID=2055889 RepID=A0ABX8CLE3_9NOCA|nr:hypothetical protein [Nocardia tengchongensis]QVI19734.1 hypothetical protein KHQ06_25735 [Nocardia tengchongensis]
MAGVMIGRIQRLRSLIEHPRTGAAERAAAQRMLDRLLSKSAATSVRPGDRNYGARHAHPGRHASLSRIAEMIADDIALARMATLADGEGDLAVISALLKAPAQLTYTVEAPAQAGILITVGAVPAAWATDADGFDSVALRALVAELTELMNAYNHDGAEVARRFVGRVRIQTVA